MRKVLLVGWDAADWQVIHPLLDAGQLPALERLVDGGVMGNLATLQPMLSPMLWTSIATGKRPPKHGILGFVEPRADGQGVQPSASTTRRGKALWNILAQNGLRCQTVGWFASHPAEPVPGGVCVTNHFAHAEGASRAGWPLAPGCVHPPRLASVMAALRVHPAELSGESLQPFIPRAAEIDQTDPAEQRRLKTLARLLAECATMHAAAIWALEHEPWDFAGVYYDAIDHFSHAFMRYHPPRMDDVDPREFERYRDVVGGIYRFQDMLLARLLELAGPDVTTLVLSDHGFYSNHLRPVQIPKRPAGPTRWHRPHGMLVIHGPGIRRDERIYGATLLDIAPTVLHLFGLPVGDDMDGHVLTSAFEDPAPPGRIASWDDVPGDAGMHPPEARQDPLAAREALRQLVDLGYIEAPDEDHETAARRATDELRGNLALAHLDAGQPAEALPLLQSLAAARPEEHRFQLALAECHLALGQIAACRELLERLYGDEAARSGRPLPQADLLLGITYLAEGRDEEALARFQRAEAAAPALPRLHNQLGAVYLRRRRWEDAERAFRRALEIDADSAPAHGGLAATLRRQGRPQEAAESALRAVGLQHFYPAAHLQLALSLAQMRLWPRAAQALETVLTMRRDAPAVEKLLRRVRARQLLASARR